MLVESFKFKSRIQDIRMMPNNDQTFMRFSADTQDIVISVPTKSELMARLSRYFSTGRGFALATLNLDHLVKLRKDPLFCEAYAQHDMVVADGNSVVWLSRLARRPVELIPGSDLILPMAELAAEQKIPVALFGSAPDVLNDAAKALQQQFPDLIIASRIAPPMGFDPASAQAEALVAEIARSGARLCFVALGAPKQERFAAFAATLAPQIGFVSIGAGLDFIAGAQTRAPAIVRSLALEWLWRMLSSPGRLGMRYLRCTLILPSLTLQALRLRRQTK
ncbi:MAG: WecB/TagA/CpsF family glycosyltransferase [Roseinatronobacter sp.]